jgi:alpha-acetolactate decarboxylase
MAQPLRLTALGQGVMVLITQGLTRLAITGLYMEFLDKRGQTGGRVQDHNRPAQTVQIATDAILY